MGRYDDYAQSVLECCQWLSEHGYFGALKGTGGNVSLRVPGEEAFVVTPSTLPYQEMTLADMCVLDFDLKTLEGERTPSVEAGMHREVYLSRPDVNAVIHTHQIFASVFAVINTPIPALFDEVGFSMGEVVEVIPYALSGSPELIANVASRLDNHCQCYLIQNHGTLSLGSTLEKAWINVELLEKTARIYLYALSTGKAVTTLPQNIIELIGQLKAV